jgi:hypothetical protein
MYTIKLKLKICESNTYRVKLEKFEVGWRPKPCQIAAIATVSLWRGIN